MKIFSLLFLTLYFTSIQVQTEEILMLLPFGSKSHKNLFTPLASALAKRGHKVTVVSMFKPSRIEENVTEIWTFAYAHLFKHQTRLVVEWGKDFTKTRQVFMEFLDIQSQMSEIFYNLSETKKWLEDARRGENGKKKYSVVFLDAAMNEAVMSLGDSLADSVVLINSAVLFPWVSESVGVPFPISYVPLRGFDAISEMTFLNRMKNLIINVMFKLFMVYASGPYIDTVAAKHTPNGRKFGEVMRDASLVLVNSDPVLDEPKPGMPNVINVGGIHCEEAKSLPQEISEFIGNSKFVIFSLGSIYDENLMEEQHEDIFINSFAQLPYKVIWKYNKKLTKTIPSNIKILKWLPQQDLLGHSQSCAFITHSGLLSMQEAIYHGVPMVSIPLFGDQPGNAFFAQTYNLTTILDLYNLTTDGIVRATITACEDPVMKISVEKRSRLFRDRPEHPLEIAVYWTEYLIRHPKALHMRNAANEVNFIQYFLIDVIIFVSITLAVPAFVCKSICQKMYKTH